MIHRTTFGSVSAHPDSDQNENPALANWAYQNIVAERAVNWILRSDTQSAVWMQQQEANTF